MDGRGGVLVQIDMGFRSQLGWQGREADAVSRNASSYTETLGSELAPQGPGASRRFGHVGQSGASKDLPSEPGKGGKPLS